MSDERANGVRRRPGAQPRRRALPALPLLVYLVVFLGYPAVHAVGLALTDSVSGAFPSSANLRLIGRDPLFWTAALNNVVLPVIGVALELAVGLAIAILLASRLPAPRVWRTIVVLPFALPEIVYLTMMRYVLAPRGYANAALAAAGLPAVDWLVPGRLGTLMTVVVVDAWHVTPIVSLMLLAALAAMPAGLHEAASLDGAGAWTRFRWVTLPLLKPALGAAALLRGLDAVRIFAAPLVLAGVEGVPVLSSYAFHQWSDYGDDGAAAAASVTLALLSVVLAAPLVARRREGAEARREQRRPPQLGASFVPWGGQ
jgi:multiple sugar transport system permease protein